MSKQVDWDCVYDYLEEHKDEYCFNSMLDGIIEASNKKCDGIDYYEKILTIGKYNYEFDEDDNYRYNHDLQSELYELVQHVARTEDKDKFDKQVKRNSRLLGWLIVCPGGTCGCDSAYTGKFQTACDYSDCDTKYFEECNCANGDCYHVIDRVAVFKTLLPGIEF